MYIIIAGATATGKSSAAVELALRINGEVVSADSMQVYRGMDAGTGKITAAETRGIKHHLIDVADPGEEYSAARWLKEASAAIDDITGRGKTAVVAGGTGLYIECLTRGLYEGKKPDERLRGTLAETFEKEGLEALNKRLLAAEPRAAEIVDMKNPRRVIRAIEIAEGASGGLFERKKRRKEGAYPGPYAMFCLAAVREELYRMIDARVDGMITKGFAGEAKNLLDRGLLQSAVSMQAIGYREMADYGAGRISLPEAVEMIKRATRNYAKRQVTWFKRYPEARVIDAGPGAAAAIEKILKAEGLI